MATTTVTVDKTVSLQTRTLIVTVTWALLATSVSESGSTASGASILMTSKTLTIQYKPVTTLAIAGNNNALAHYKQSPGCEQILHHEYSLLALSDVISIYSLDLGKLPGCSSYE